MLCSASELHPCSLIASICVAASCIAAPAIATSAPKPQVPLPSPESSLTVGIKAFQPFVFASPDSDEPAYGYSIDLWKAIAEQQNLETQFVSYESVPELLDALEAGEVDVAISGLSITSERLKREVRFSYPYYQSGLQLMVKRQQQTGLSSLLGFLGHWSSLKAVLLIIGSSAIVGALIWALEHRHNEGFPQHPVAGVGQGLWFAIVTLGTFGYGDVTPLKWPARIVTTVWMGISFFIVAHFISSMTVHSIESDIGSLKDLRGEAIAVVAGTTAEAFLRSQPVTVQTYPSFAAATEALDGGEVEGLVRDYPEVQYFASHNPEFEVVGDRLTREDYGIAVAQKNRAVLDNIDYQLLRLQEQGVLRSLEIKWFGLELAGQDK